MIADLARTAQPCYPNSAGFLEGDPDLVSFANPMNKIGLRGIGLRPFAVFIFHCKQ